MESLRQHEQDCLFEDEFIHNAKPGTYFKEEEEEEEEEERRRRRRKRRRRRTGGGGEGRLEHNSRC